MAEPARLEIYEPIASAPRDGRFIWVAADGEGEHLMRWDATATNGLIPDVVGFWCAPNKAYTWAEGEFGPTHWRPTKGGCNG